MQVEAIIRPVEGFDLILGMLVAILGLHRFAARLRWPPSIAFLAGGRALAFLPGGPRYPDPFRVSAQ
jgi:monovalent cation/hydrogen antiporter